MQKSRYTIRVMTRQEVDIAIDWAAAEGWNPGLYDANCFYAADPNGFLIGLLGDEPIATVSVVKYGDSFGFLGFYIVKPAYRGKGYGIQIWNAGLAQLRGRTIGLDGVVDRQGNYQNSGLRWPIQTSDIGELAAGIFRLIQGSCSCPRSFLMRYAHMTNRFFPTIACNS
ncbi:GNAT family N-acetyltransferase [Undibacterium arcticum]|uniref:GNAT family N-acetyltransferase n=1 Tax=Undibacterium arcticum TaxID=1762892 RepID=UPI00360CAC7A